MPFGKPSLALVAVTLAACNASGRDPVGGEPEPAQQLTAPRTEQSDRDDTLRVLDDDELTPAIIEQAKQILEQHSDEPFGYEVPFQLDGKRYLGRIEEHYRPPGSSEGPTGEHVGVTVYVYD